MAANDSQYASAGLPGWVKVAGVAIVVMMLVGLGWFGRDLVFARQTIESSQVKTNEIAASYGNKSTFSDESNGKTGKQQLDSGNLSDLLQQRLEATSDFG